MRTLLNVAITIPLLTNPTECLILPHRIPRKKRDRTFFCPWMAPT